MDKKFLNSLIFDFSMLVISLIEILFCIYTNRAIQYVFIESIIMIVLIALILLVFGYKYKVIKASTIFAMIVFLVSYIAILLQIYYHFIYIVRYGSNYYNTYYLFPGILIIQRCMENVYYSRLGSGSTILLLNYYFVWFFIIFDFASILFYKNNKVQKLRKTEN
jgi:hypothetical protein